MIKYVVVLLSLMVLLPAAQAQQSGHVHDARMEHGGQDSGQKRTIEASPREPGQSAFAAIQEIIELLMADPGTDWGKVNIDALRRHLVDMDNVTLHADVRATPLPSGVRYVVTGKGNVRQSIARMVTAHAETMDGANGMRIIAEGHPEGTVMTVTVASPDDLPKLQGLGFFGVMTWGMHHQAHHLMIARGEGPHG